MRLVVRNPASCLFPMHQHAIPSLSGTSALRPLRIRTVLPQSCARHLLFCLFFLLPVVRPKPPPLYERRHAIIVHLLRLIFADDALPSYNFWRKPPLFPSPNPHLGCHLLLAIHHLVLDRGSTTSAFNNWFVTSPPTGPSKP
jgi:hypothetical protein